MTEHTHTRSATIEGLVLVLITVAVGAMAGAASFTHMHDWTMANSPAGTPQWFGWANAVVSELTPTASVLVLRRRRHHGQPIAFPAFVLIASVALSLSAQFAQATPSVSGWLLAAVPALGFLAMTKLALSHTTTSPATPSGVAEDQAPEVPVTTTRPEPAGDRPVFVPWTPAPVPAQVNGTTSKVPDA